MSASRMRTAPAPLSRADRLLCHSFMESVRDYLSNPEYMDLTLEQKGLMAVLRHYVWHADQGVLPVESTKALSRLIRIDEEEIVRNLPPLMAAGFFLHSPDGRGIWCRELEDQVEAAVKKTKALKKAGQKGGESKGDSPGAKGAKDDQERDESPSERMPSSERFKHAPKPAVEPVPVGIPF